MNNWLRCPKPSAPSFSLAQKIALQPELQGNDDLSDALVSMQRKPLRAAAA
jgi:hypothetical protein